MILRIALRNLLRNRRRTLYTISAVAFGLLCLIVFQALKVGLHEQMVRSTVGLDAGALQIHAKGHEANIASLLPLPEPQVVEEFLGKTSVTAYARRIKSPALLIANAKSTAVLLSGVERVREPSVTFISENMVAGDYLAPGGLLIGENLANSLGVGLGDDVALMVEGWTGAPFIRKFPVKGIYRTALATFDLGHVFMPLPQAQEFLRADGVVTELVAASEAGGELSAANEVREKLNGDDRYSIRYWGEIAPDVKQLIDLNDSTMALLIIIVYLIVAVGIVNTMSMAVYERFHEIGIQLAVGDTPRSIFLMILTESALLGLIASILGSLMGWLACLCLGKYGVDLTSLTSSNQYFAQSHILKSHLILSDLGWANLLTVTTATLAGIFPALKAVRMEVVEALNHG